MKQKKKMSLAMQIFIALILAIVVGLLMQRVTLSRLEQFF